MSTASGENPGEAGWEPLGGVKRPRSADVDERITAKRVAPDRAASPSMSSSDSELEFSPELLKPLPSALRFYDAYTKEEATTGTRAEALEPSKGGDLAMRAMGALVADAVGYIPKEELFTSFAQAVKVAMEADVGLLTVFDDELDVQHFIGSAGSPLRGTIMKHSFCRHMKGQQELLVENAKSDERFRCNPLCTGELASLDFYYGAPVMMDGEQVGALCVLSHETKESPTDVQRDIVKHMARCAAHALAQRRCMVRHIVRQSRRVMDMVRKDLRWEAEHKFMKAEMRLCDDSINQVCHEIRGHMATIRIALEDVKTAAKLGQAPDAEELEGALHSLDCQDRVLRMRLDVGRLLSGNYQLQLSTFDFTALLDSVLQRQSIAAGPGVDFLRNLTEEVWIRTDAYLIEQVLENLVGNARKHTHDGFVRVDAELLEGTKAGTGRLRFVVSDTGCGIRPEKLARLFHRYSSIESTGSGLGLFLVDRVAAAMQGYVRLLWTRTMDFRYSESTGTAGARRQPSPTKQDQESPPEIHTVEKPAAATQVRSGAAFEFEVPLEPFSASELSPLSQPLKRETPLCFRAGVAQGPGVPVRMPKVTPESMPRCGPREAGIGGEAAAASTNVGAAAPKGGASLPRENPIAGLPSLEHATVFIVDDTTSLRTSLERRFRKLDGPLPWTVKGARTAEECLAALRREPAHIIVFDENMAPAGGALTGTEATAILRCQGFDGVIIGWSGYDNMAQQQLSAGADLIWGKPPPPPQQMCQEILRALEGRGIIADLGKSDAVGRFLFNDGASTPGEISSGGAISLV